MRDEPIFGLEMIASTDATFIEQSLTPFLESKRVTQIVVMLSEKHYVNGREIQPDGTAEVLERLKSPKMRIFPKEYPSKVYKRNTAIDLLVAKKCNMILHFDPDEILLPSQLNRLLDWIEAHPHQLYSMSLISYWKDFKRRCDPISTAVVATTAEVRFNAERVAWGWDQVVLPEEFFYFHLGFALPPDAMLEKCRRSSFHPLWYESIWKNWSEGMTGPYPVHSSMVPNIVSVEPDQDLIGYLKQFEIKESKSEKSRAKRAKDSGAEVDGG